MDGYILDTNILLFLMNKRESCHDIVWEGRRACPYGAPIWVSPVALGEIDVGCWLIDADTSTARQEVTEFVHTQGFRIARITKHTAFCYGDLKARLMQQYNRVKLKKKNRAKWPEAWPEPSTGRALGVDENDLWIVSQALERSLVLVTHDNMNRIREVADKLRVEDWAAN